MTSSRLLSPAGVYKSLKKNVDVAAAFDEANGSGFTLDSSMIRLREVRVAVPPTKNSLQWQEIQRAVDYANSKAIRLTIEKAAGN